MATILLVDDNSMLLSALSRRLSKEHDVHPVPSVVLAKERLEARSFDVLVTDLHVADDSGLTLLGEVASRFPKTKCILMSGDLTTVDALKAYSLGAFRVLSKPFQLTELRCAVECALAPNGSADEPAPPNGTT